MKNSRHPEVVQFITTVLTERGPTRAALMKESVMGMGIPESALQRMRERAGVATIRASGFANPPWYWYLADQPLAEVRAAIAKKEGQS